MTMAMRNQTSNFTKVFAAFTYYRNIKSFDPTPNKRNARLQACNKFELSMKEIGALASLIKN